MAVMGSGFDGPSFILANPDSAYDRYWKQVHTMF